MGLHLSNNGWANDLRLHHSNNGGETTCVALGKSINFVPDHPASSITGKMAIRAVIYTCVYTYACVYTNCRLSTVLGWEGGESYLTRQVLLDNPSLEISMTTSGSPGSRDSSVGSTHQVIIQHYVRYYLTMSCAMYPWRQQAIPESRHWICFNWFSPPRCLGSVASQ